MVYVPNSVDNFNAALAGAIAGIGTTLRVPQDQDASSDVNTEIVDVAAAFAEEMDTLLGSTSGEYFVFSLEALCAGWWANRGPSQASKVAADYEQPCRALLALVVAGFDFLSSNGIPSTGTGLSVVKQIVGNTFSTPAFAPVTDGNHAEVGSISFIPANSSDKVTLEWMVPVNNTGGSDGQVTISVLDNDGSTVSSATSTVTAGNNEVLSGCAALSSPNPDYTLRITVSGAGATLESAGDAVFIATDYKNP